MPWLAPLISFYSLTTVIQVSDLFVDFLLSPGTVSHWKYTFVQNKVEAHKMLFLTILSVNGLKNNVKLKSTLLKQFSHVLNLLPSVEIDLRV